MLGVVAITYRCDATLGCTFIVWDRNVTPDQWREQFRQLSADPAFPPGSLMLADLSTAGGAAAITSDVIGEMAVALKARAERMDPVRLAVVPNGAWEKARELERAVAGSGITTIVFNDVLTACTWLGLRVELVNPVLAALRSELAAD